MLGLSTEESVIAAIHALLKEHDDPSVPLPSTRKLGQLLGFSHVTVSKALRQMGDEGELWRNENGRYYPKSARLLFDAPKPVTCFFRSISAWASWYSRLVQGIGLACEEANRGLLMLPASSLIQQDASDAVPQVLGVEEQCKLLESLLLRTQDEPGRLILDDLWDDRALTACADQLAGARVLLRACPVPGIGSVAPDFAQGALLALSHLLAQGYERVVVVRPFSGKVIDAMVEAFEEAVEGVNLDAAHFTIIDSDQGGDTAQVVARLCSAKERTGVYCAEENFAVALYQGLTAAGVDIPGKIALLAGWGTGEAARLGLSSLKIDLQHLGMLAVSLENPALHPFRPVTNFTLHRGISS
jgi:DNA-binding LacI/PurR family transcriptional regulator